MCFQPFSVSILIVMWDSILLSNWTGLQSLVDMCLSVIVNSEELLSRLSELPPRIVTQINEAMNVNCFLLRPTLQ